MKYEAIKSNCANANEYVTSKIEIRNLKGY